MKSIWRAAALLTVLASVACGGRDDNDPREAEETAAPAPGAPAVGGAIVGGILGGGSGAAKGAVIGGAAGTGVVLAMRGEEVTLGKGTVLAVSLASPLTVRVPAR